MPAKKSSPSDLAPKETKLDIKACPSSSCTSLKGSDICRICHEGDLKPSLIAPCHCAGSLRYVHQACLQRWLKSSNTRHCELCKFQFILQTKMKPFKEWGKSDVSGEFLCAVVFHAVAIVCVLLSTYVLIELAIEEAMEGTLNWSLSTKLTVLALGVKGGVIFMFIQYRAYMQIFSRWKAHNRVIYVQNITPRLPTAQVYTAVPISSIVAGSSTPRDVPDSDLAMGPSINCQYRPYQDKTCQTPVRQAASKGEATNVDLCKVHTVRIFLGDETEIQLSKNDGIKVDVADAAATGGSSKTVISNISERNDGNHASVSWRVDIEGTAEKTGEKGPSEN